MNTPTREHPRLVISVVVPTCHRINTLSECLERLAPGRQKGFGLLGGHENIGHSQLYEVIVSDAGSLFTAGDIILTQYPWARWVAATKLGPGLNRNRGAREVRGEWIAFLDDDCLPRSDWLEKLALRAGYNVDVIEGAVHSPDLPDHPLWTAPVNLIGGAGWTANLCVKRTTFERLGGFDPDLPETAEDMEFRQRSLRARCGWVFAADAIVLHPPRKMTWVQFWNETLRFRWWFMYRLKTGSGAGIHAGPLRVLGDVFIALACLYTRSSWYLLRDGVRSGNLGCRRTILHVRDWILFPLLAPYFWKWAMCYRVQLRKKISV